MLGRHKRGASGKALPVQDEPDDDRQVVDAQHRHDLQNGRPDFRSNLERCFKHFIGKGLHQLKVIVRDTARLVLILRQKY